MTEDITRERKVLSALLSATTQALSELKNLRKTVTQLEKQQADKVADDVQVLHQQMKQIITSQDETNKLLKQANTNTSNKVVGDLAKSIGTVNTNLKLVASAFDNMNDKVERMENRLSTVESTVQGVSDTTIETATRLGVIEIQLDAASQTDKADGRDSLDEAVEGLRSLMD